MQAVAPPRPTRTNETTWRVPPPGGTQRHFARLVPGPEAAADARVRVAAVIDAWDIQVDADAALLLTSELVANAVLHGEGPVAITVRSAAGHLRVDVEDSSPAMPVPPAPDRDLDAFSAENGRGLLLVDALATGWGCYRTPAGKSVYFILAV